MEQFQDLPPAWEARQDNYGRIYFINHQDKTTTWQDPRTTSPGLQIITTEKEEDEVISSPNTYIRPEQNSNIRGSQNSRTQMRQQQYFLADQSGNEKCSQSKLKEFKSTSNDEGYEINDDTLCTSALWKRNHLVGGIICQPPFPKLLEVKYPTYRYQSKGLLQSIFAREILTETKKFVIAADFFKVKVMNSSEFLGQHNANNENKTEYASVESEQKDPRKHDNTKNEGDPRKHDTTKNEEDSRKHENTKNEEDPRKHENTKNDEVEKVEAQETKFGPPEKLNTVRPNLNKTRPNITPLGGTHKTIDRKRESLQNQKKSPSKSSGPSLTLAPRKTSQASSQGKSSVNKPSRALGPNPNLRKGPQNNLARGPNPNIKRGPG